MRFFARAKLDLPVTLNGRFSGSSAAFTDLSLNGAFIRIRGQFPSVREGDSLFLKYDLPGYGYFDHSGKTVRKDPGWRLFFPASILLRRSNSGGTYPSI